MAKIEYNPLGGTAQSLINDYHAQMADIDRQLYETGSYTGPVFNPKTNTVDVQTLNKRQAKLLKDKLWYEADKLEGYGVLDRHRRFGLRSILAGIARALRALNPVYQFKLYRATKLYDSNIQDMYEAIQVPEKAPAEVLHVKIPAPQPEPLKQITKEIPVPPQVAPPVITPPQPTQKEEKDYQKILYDKVQAIVDQSGCKKSEALLQLIMEKPVRILSVKPEDVTKNIATQAVLGMSQVKQKPVNDILIEIAYKNPAIVKADNKTQGLESIFKVYPRIIETVPGSLKYFNKGAISLKTTEYVLHDIKEHVQEGQSTQDVVKAFEDQVKQIDSPAAKRMLENITSLSVPQVTPPPAPAIVPPIPQPPQPPQPPIIPAPTVLPQLQPMPPINTGIQPPPIPQPPTPQVVPQVPNETDFPPHFAPGPDFPYPTQPELVPDGSDELEYGEEYWNDWRNIPELAALQDITRTRHPEVDSYPDMRSEMALLDAMIKDHPELYKKVPDISKSTIMTAYAVIDNPDMLIEAPEGLYLDDIADAVIQELRARGPQSLDNMIQTLTIQDDQGTLIQEQKALLQMLNDEKMRQSEREYTREYDEFTR